MARRKEVKVAPIKEGVITYQPITETIEKNYMPYVMSVIISRALPEIDGFKPSQRKLLYTMYKMGLFGSNRTKSNNVVGQTMCLHPHGDAAIYETMVRLTRDNETLLHPFIDSKGAFGKHYSRNMAFAASRYTEVKLDSFAQELFRGIDKNAVDMVPNYDNTLLEPTLFPTSFPNVLVSPNLGIAVGMACSICSFNLEEICDGTIALLKNPNTSIDRLMEIIKAPDFSGGGLLIYEREKMREIFESGTGSVRLRARYTYNKADNAIEVLQIPYSTDIEAIMNKINDLVKAGKLKEVAYVRDAIDRNGFKMVIELRNKTVDPDKLMQKLFKVTTLEDNFNCNFNVLIDGYPRHIGVRDILLEWIKFRKACFAREMTFDLEKKKSKLHLLLGLAALLLDIDKAIAIIRQTEREEDVVPNLMEGFSLSEVQAEYIAEIKLRHLNREYILNRVQEIESLQKDIAEYEAILADELKLKACIADQLREIKKKHGKPRKTQLIGAEEIVEIVEEEEEENYEVHLVMTRDGYFKKFTKASMRGIEDQKLKEGDEVTHELDTDNRAELMILTNMAQAYKCRVKDFDVMKPAMLGDFLPAKLGMDDGERPMFICDTAGYAEGRRIVLIFENGKGVRIPIKQYETKSNRRRLSPAFSSASPLVAAFDETKPFDILIMSEARKGIAVPSDMIPEKATRTANGATVLSLKAKKKVYAAMRADASAFSMTDGVRKRKIPATAVALTKK